MSTKKTIFLAGKEKKSSFTMMRRKAQLLHA